MPERVKLLLKLFNEAAASRWKYRKTFSKNKTKNWKLEKLEKKLNEFVSWFHVVWEESHHSPFSLVYPDDVQCVRSVWGLINSTMHWILQESDWSLISTQDRSDSGMAKMKERKIVKSQWNNYSNAEHRRRYSRGFDFIVLGRVWFFVLFSADFVGKKMLSNHKILNNPTINVWPLLVDHSCTSASGRQLNLSTFNGWRATYNWNTCKLRVDAEFYLYEVTDRKFIQLFFLLSPLCCLMMLKSFFEVENCGTCKIFLCWTQTRDNFRLLDTKKNYMSTKIYGLIFMRFIMGYNAFRAVENDSNHIKEFIIW